MHCPNTRHINVLSWFMVTIITLCLVLVGCRHLRAQQTTKPTSRTAEPNYANDPYWQQAKKEVYKSVLDLMAQHQDELLHNIRYHKLIHGNVNKRQIALTFDDGPHPLYTPQILNILAREQVKATFFVVGKMAEMYPNLVRAEYNDGHSVGNHTYHHVNLTKIPEPDVATEIKGCGEVLQCITGRAPHLFRPPGGDYDTEVITTSEALGYTTVLWTDDPGDYAHPGEQIILQRALLKARNGGIILLHDGVQQTISILPQLIDTLKKQGYEFVTIDKMIESVPSSTPRLQEKPMTNMPDHKKI